MTPHLLHVLAPSPEGNPEPLIEAQAAGAQVTIVRVGGGEGKPSAPAGATVRGLDPARRDEDADALLDLVYACDSTVFW